MVVVVSVQMDGERITAMKFLFQEANAAQHKHTL